MNHDPENTLLDGCLDEVLAGRTPPDLTARILQAWSARGAAAVNALPAALPANGEPVAPPVQHWIAPALAQPVMAIPHNGDSAVSRRPIPINVPTLKRAVTERRSRSSNWQLLIAASLVGIGVAVGGGMYMSAVSQRTLTAQGETKKTPKVIASKSVPAGNVFKIAGKSPQQTPETTSIPTPIPQPTTNRVESVPAAPELATHLPPAVTTDITPTAPAAIVEKPYRHPSPDREVVSFVNANVQQSWTANSVRPSPLASDSEWCRRVYLRILGRIPSVAELKTFAGSKSPEKRAALVEHLLSDDEYIEQYAQHWATVWSNLLIGRTGGTQRDSLVSREGLEQYLRQSLVANKPYDQLARELLTATGSGKPGTDQYNGAANFLLAALNDESTLATARTSRVFLGQQLQCAQCHEHPTGTWTQHQYWALNSFFRQTRIEKHGDSSRLVDSDFADDQGNADEPLVYYQIPSGILKSAQPQFIDGTKIPVTGRISEVNRREELAKLVLRSDDFPRALVNRYWSHFFGFGFTRPVDDMGENNTPSHPELLERLAQEFVARDFDLKSVIRWIVLSDPFQRSSQIVNENFADAPEAGSAPLFSHYYSRQLPAEEVYNSLLAAAEIRKSAAGGKDLGQARVDWLAQFHKSMATDDAEEETQFDGSMRQSLIMLNGDLMRHAVSSQHEGLLQSVAKSNLKFDEKIEHLFLAALSRQPMQRELDAARQIAANNRGNDAAALEDILWALLNSNEFILDH